MAAPGVAQAGDSSSRGGSGGSAGAGVAVQGGSPGILPSAPGMVTPEGEEGGETPSAPAVSPEPPPRAQACSGDTDPADPPGFVPGGDSGWHCPTRGCDPQPGPRERPWGRWRCAGTVLGDRCHPLRPAPRSHRVTPQAQPWGPRGGGRGLRAGLGGPRVSLAPLPRLSALFGAGFFSLAAEERGTAREFPGSRAGSGGPDRARSPAGGSVRAPRPFPSPPGSGAAPNPAARRGCVGPLCPDNAEESQRFRARGGPRPLGLGKPRRGERGPPTRGSGRFGHPGVLGVPASTP